MELGPFTGLLLLRRTLATKGVGPSPARRVRPPLDLGGGTQESGFSVILRSPAICCGCPIKWEGRFAVPRQVCVILTGGSSLLCLIAGVLPCRGSESPPGPALSPLSHLGLLPIPLWAWAGEGACSRSQHGRGQRGDPPLSLNCLQEGGFPLLSASHPGGPVLSLQALTCRHWAAPKGWGRQQRGVCCGCL